MNRFSNRLSKGGALVGAWALVVIASLPMFAARNAGHRPGGAQSDPSHAKKIPIYIKDFELAAVKSPNSTPPPKKNGNQGQSPAETPALQARRIVDAFGTTLTQTFQQNGFTVSRQNGSLPTEGLLLRGVFAEPDPENRIRRAILGAGAPGPTFLLYIGAFNLSRPDQPLYINAPAQSNDAHYGPVLSMNAYIPMVKFEIPKDPSETDVRKVCDQVVSQLTALLVANPSAMAK
jgi:hypothetical protein